MIRILSICTGNICRSPLAAQLLQKKLDPKYYQIRSAGTAVLLGERSPKEAQRVANSMGLGGIEEHRATLMTTEAIDQADLILGMERIHRREAARSHPTAAKRTFTLLEFAHVASRLEADELEVLVQDHLNSKAPAFAAVARMRGAVPRLPSGRHYDVEDPFGRSQQAYERSARQIETAVDQIVAFFDRAKQLGRKASTFLR